VIASRPDRVGGHAAEEFAALAKNGNADAVVKAIGALVGDEKMTQKQALELAKPKAAKAAVQSDTRTVNVGKKKLCDLHFATVCSPCGLAASTVKTSPRNGRTRMRHSSGRRSNRAHPRKFSLDEPPPQWGNDHGRTDSALPGFEVFLTGEVNKINDLQKQVIG
jgi:hypothetical protein